MLVLVGHKSVREDGHESNPAHPRHCALSRWSVGGHRQRVRVYRRLVIMVLTSASEITVKVVNTDDVMNLLYLRDCPKPAKHLSFHPSGSYLAVSCTDGIVYLYSLSTDKPELVGKIEDVIRVLETDTEATSKAVWHPDGRAFAAATVARDIQVISWSDGEKQKAFSGAHMGDVTAIAWSPNGALLASAGADRKVVLWEAKTQRVLARRVLL